MNQCTFSKGLSLHRNVFIYTLCVFLFVCTCLCELPESLCMQTFQTGSHQSTWSLDLKPSGKKHHRKPSNFLCQSMSRSRFCLSLLQDDFFSQCRQFFLYFPQQQMFFFMCQTIKGCWGLWTKAASTPTAPFVHTSVTAERPGQSLRFPRPLGCFTVEKTTGQ